MKNALLAYFLVVALGACRGAGAESESSSIMEASDPYPVKIMCRLPPEGFRLGMDLLIELNSESATSARVGIVVEEPVPTKRLADVRHLVLESNPPTDQYALTFADRPSESLVVRLPADGTTGSGTWDSGLGGGDAQLSCERQPAPSPADQGASNGQTSSAPQNSERLISCAREWFDPRGIDQFLVEYSVDSTGGSGLVTVKVEAVNFELLEKSVKLANPSFYGKVFGLSVALPSSSVQCFTSAQDKRVTLCFAGGSEAAQIALETSNGSITIA